MTPFSADSDDTLRELRTLVGTGRFREAVDFYYQTPDEDWRENPEAQLLTATSATRLGELDVAGPLAESATARFRDKVDRHGRMRASNLLGVVRVEQGRIAEAEQHLGEALALAHELADSLVAARAANNLASLAQVGNRPETALSLYRSALVTYQRIGDRQGMVETYHNLGIVFRQSGNMEGALEANDNAVRLAEATGDSGLIAPALAGLAEAHVATEDFQLAVHEAQRAEELAEQAGDPLVVAEALRILALGLLALNELTRAYRAATDARAIATEHQSRLLEGEATAALALVLRAMDREVEAESWREVARTIFAALRADGFQAEFDRAWEGEVIGG